MTEPGPEPSNLDRSAWSICGAEGLPGIEGHSFREQEVHTTPFPLSLPSPPPPSSPWQRKKHPSRKVRPDPAGGSVMPATSSLPLSLSPFHSSPCILLTWSWDGPIPAARQAACAPALPPAHPPVGPWSTFSCPFYSQVPWPGGRWNCAPATPAPRRGSPFASCPICFVYHATAV